LISFIIETKPIPKGRPRFTRTGHSYTPKRTKDYEKLISDTAREHISQDQCLDVPVVVNACFNFAIPKSYNALKRQDCLSGMVLPAADLDNLLKSLLDGLNKIAFTDDTLVQRIKAQKKYAHKDFIEVEIKKCPAF
jgi:Holliday junction resolvase RusA-like endonuclease